MRNNVKFFDILRQNFIFFIPIGFCYYVTYMFSIKYQRYIFLNAVCILFLSILINILGAIFEQTIYKKYLFEGTTKCKFKDFMKEIEKNDQVLYGFTILNSVKLYLWSLLFIIPGIIKYLEYSRQILVHIQNPYINNLDEIRIIARDEMVGKKLKLFFNILLYTLGVMILGDILLPFSLSSLILINIISFAIIKITQIYFHLNTLES